MWEPPRRSDKFPQVSVKESPFHSGDTSEIAGTLLNEEVPGSNPGLTKMVGAKMAAILRSSGITRGKTSAENVGLGTQHTWRACEQKGKIPTASRRKRLLLQNPQEVHERGG